ncbi:hypothetical protein X728_11440 [Mesorhizobium sp. L103C120A0]|nr:hypothetical protein X728_11440 [Mesorhizobium sp. L103C120A0]
MIATWGREGFEGNTIWRLKFAHKAAPALASFANSSLAPFIIRIKASAKEDCR